MKKLKKSWWVPTLIATTIGTAVYLVMPSDPAGPGPAEAQNDVRAVAQSLQLAPDSPRALAVRAWWYYDVSNRKQFTACHRDAETNDVRRCVVPASIHERSEEAAGVPMALPIRWKWHYRPSPGVLSDSRRFSIVPIHC